MSARRDQLVVFRIADRMLAVPVGDVVDVIRMAAVQPLPGAPPWLLGVLNLRGDAVPVVDVGARIGLRPARVHPDDRVVVVAAGGRLVGGVVAEVSGSVIEPDECDAVDDRLPTDGARAIARIGADLVPVLDVSRVWDPGAAAAEELSAWLA